MDCLKTKQPILFFNLLRRKNIQENLFFVTTAFTTPTGTFEFPSPSANERLNVGSGFASGTEVTVGFASCPSALKQDGVLSSGSLQSQLVQSHNFSAGLQNGSRAFSVTCKAATVNLGILKILKSLVTVPTTTAILPSRPSFFIFLINLAKEIGGLLILDIKRRRSTISLNLASVLRAKNRYNFTRSLK